MLSRLTNTTIFFHWHTLVLLSIFMGARILSFFVFPYPLVQASLVFIVLIILGIVFFKNPFYAWILVMTELLLGGAGHLFEFFGLSLRTVLILVFVILWTGYALSSSQHHILRIPHKFFYLLIPLPLLIFVSAIIGLSHGHTLPHIIADAIPFFFFILSIPIYYVFEKKYVQEYFIRLMGTYIVGSSLFSLYTYILFVSNTSKIHGRYYTWYRDSIMGKITYITDFFYRIVTPEHLLIPFILLIIASLLMRKESHNIWWRIMFILSSVVLVLNFSRAYILAFSIGLVVLWYHHSFKKWFTVSLWTISVLIGIFISINVIASSGQSIGLELAGIRIGSFIHPQTEISTYTRMMLISPIVEQIKQAPFWGQGIGSTLTYYNSLTSSYVTTTQYDWGYLELIAEFGIIGTLLYVSIILIIIIELVQKIRHLPDFRDLHVGLLGSIVALLVMTITSPALFHVFGIIFLTFSIAFIASSPHIFDDAITTLYRIFNKIKK